MELAKKDQIGLWLQSIFVFFLPLWQQVSVVSLIALVVFAILSGKWKESFTLFKADKALWLFVSFYLIHVLGMFYSSNLSYGFFDLQVKLSYLLIPLVLSSLLILSHNLRIIKWSFILGNTLAGIICVLIALSKYYKDGLFSHFFYIDFSHFLHTSYFSMYLNLSIIFLIDEWLSKKSKNKLLSNAIPVLSLFLLYLVILLFARTALAVCYLSILLFLILKRKQWFPEKKKVFVLFSAGVFVLIFQLGALHFNNRFVQVEKAMESSNTAGNEISRTTDTSVSEEENSTSTRFKLWKNALLLIKQHPIVGVGTGDIKDELNAEYRSTGYEYGAKGDFNPHNQYLHTMVMLGIAGISILLAYLIIPFRIAIMSRNWLYLSFLLIIILNSLTESILEVQKGVLWVAFFQVLFYINCKHQQDDRTMNVQKST
ncbi:MAG: O-antigen ligase domain-containing protein [Bacteroidetes bacterium]|nr:MAG: O-antigen ligase domain-containing protein [Bacteroidota bacterium]